MEFNKLSILIPVFNEEKTVRHVLEKVNSIELINNLQKEIVIVDDCSRDKTSEEIEKFIKDFPEVEVKFSRHKKNQGKGAGIRTGIEEATGDYVIIQDADLEYDPNEINRLLQPIVDGNADVVLGSRFLSGSSKRVLYFWHSMGNKFLTMLSNFMTDLNLSDMEVGYKLIPTKILRSFVLEENRFGFEPEIVGKLAGIKGLRIYEVGISYYGRTYEEGKKINWKDGFRAIYCIFKYSPLLKKVGGFFLLKKPEEALRKVNPNVLFFIFLLAGIVFRVRDYLFQRSFWLDEAFLANNIRDRNFLELLSPLDYSQIAPVGFLYLEKLSLFILGPSELSLRFIPLLAGILSMILFYYAATKLYNRSVALIFLLLVSLSHYLIIYSNELKQYSSDVFFCSLILFLFAKVHDSQNPKKFLVIGVYYGIIIWFSNPAIIVITGFILAWFLLTSIQMKLRILIVIYWFGPALISFIAYYFTFLYNHPTQVIMQNYWADHFLPLDNFYDTWNWIQYRIKSFYQNSMMTRTAFIPIAIGLTLIGIITQIFQDYKYKAILFAPIILHLSLSALKMYPFETRIFLYSIPLVLLYISIALSVLGFLLNSRIIMATLAFLMINKTLQYDLELFKKPRNNEHLRPVLEEVASKIETAQKIYVYSSSQPAFKYYSPMIFEDGIETQVINAIYLDFPQRFKDQLASLNGKIWFVFSHPYPPWGINTIDSLVIARKLPVLDSIYDNAARAYLVDISKGDLNPK